MNSATSEERKLAAIMFADMVGYTAVSQRNEALALELLSQYGVLLRPLFVQFHGNEIKTIGDAFLVEFASALSAAQCAVEIQRSLHAYNVSAPEERQILARIGLHVGDIVHREGDVFGDSVNIAARIQSTADPGCISVSEDVARQIRNKIDVPLSELQPRTLKNLQYPLRIFGLQLPWLSSLPTAGREESQTASHVPSVAVLPFVNMSSDPGNEYFSDGLAEDLINAMSQLEGLHVTARTSAFRFRGTELDIREIGEQLNVGTILEGSVRRAGTKLRVTAQLINVADGYHLWSERYDRELEDVFAIQDEISLAIVGKLKVKLLGDDKTRLAKRYTESFEVYDLYLKGRYYVSKLTEEGIKRSLDLFQQAIAKDPNYALAYVGVASVYNVLAIVGQFASNEVMPKAKAELLKALRLDDSLAEAHAWLGEVYLQYEWDWSSAEKEFQRAIKLKPNSPEAHQFYADYLIVTGSLDEALVEVERARDLDPLSTIPITILAYRLFVLRQFDLVVELCQKSLKTEPSFLLQLHLWRGLRRQNRLSEALVECKRLFTLFISREVAEAMECVDAESGYKSAMRAAAKKLVELSTQRYISPYLIATLFAHAEDDNETLQWFEKAHEGRDMVFYSIGVDPDSDRVRTNPRFVALLEKIGLRNDK